MTFAPQMNTPDLVDILGAGINDIADGFIERQNRKKGENAKAVAAKQAYPDASPEEIKQIANLPDDLFKAALGSQASVRAAVEKEGVKQRGKLDFAKQLGLNLGQPDQTQQPNIAERLGVSEEPKENAPITEDSPVVENVPGETQYPGPDKYKKPSPIEAEKFTDEQIAAVSLIDPSAARILQDQKNQRNKQIRSLRDARSKPGLDFIDKVNANASDVLSKESDLESMQQAVKDGDLDFLSLDNFAEMTGLDGLRSPEGARFNSSVKEYFLSDIKRVGQRPNQWIEQQLRSALPRIGRSEEANLTVLEGMKFKNELSQKLAETTNQMADEYEETLGYLPRNFGAEVNKRMGIWVKQRQDLLEKRIRQIKTGEKEVKQFTDEELYKELRLED